MISDKELIDWIHGQLWAKRAWLERFAGDGREKRGPLEVSQKVNDIKMLEALNERLSR